MSDPGAPGARLLALWGRLAPLPGGPWLFGRLLGRRVPYSGTIHPRVRALEPGYARVEITNRRRIRNHLRSVHAVALANLGELTTGLATLTALPAGIRGIPTGLAVEYGKKARGRLACACRSAPPAAATPVEHTVEAEIRDGDGDVVATVRATWRLGPVPGGAGG
ncbi:MAG: hotdog fold domain-containing protein [Gemmatimonadota bacterium]